MRLTSMRPTSLLAVAILLSATAGAPNLAKAIEGASPAAPQTHDATAAQHQRNEESEKDQAAEVELAAGLLQRLAQGLRAHLRQGRLCRRHRGAARHGL